MQPESAALLWDVHAAATRVAEFIVGLDAANYAADDLRRSAVERQLEIVGETSLPTVTRLWTTRSCGALRHSAFQNS